MNYNINLHLICDFINSCNLFVTPFTFTMATSSPTNLNVTQYFNHPIIAHIASIPNHDTMTVLQTELNTNAMSVPLDQTPLGHL